MAFHWQSKVNYQNIGVDDMVLLSKLNEQSIVENLKKRLMANSIFTYIGPVLIVVNPFKEMPYFTPEEMNIYRGGSQYENPPHIYAIADTMFRNLLIDCENQCVIISGESGAGKTVEAKYIMGYLATISGGGKKVQHIKDVILQSNPLLESFGNSATIRNWNSSRFGKYVEIIFSRGGEPIGGRISNFLLERSRIVHQNQGERNFHIFYQLCAGAEATLRENLGITNPDYYNYLNKSGMCWIDVVDDSKDFQQTIHAMDVIGISNATQLQILQLVAAILHIGNITFVEEHNYSSIEDEQFLEFPAFLLGLRPEDIKEKLTSRHMESKWGKNVEQIDVSLNVEQSEFTRDAFAKDLYARLFDFLIMSTNGAMKITTCTSDSPFSIGILDIYGFEIVNRNGFDQFCINFVNEKLQQIFIELTLKAEQEEYISEGIKWKPIEYFNNKVVCDLIESKKPPGIMCLLDDICSQNHGKNEGVDIQFLVELNKHMAHNEYYRSGAESFLIRHYAGDVIYNVNGFCEKNRDTFYRDLIQLMQQSDKPFIVRMYPETILSGAKSKPTSFSSKIRNQANDLVISLSKCSPHYVRCIKPNETKKPLEWDERRVLHQIEYLGLKENIRVRRAGFAYRRLFGKFLHRYAILSKETWPTYRGDPRKGVEIICSSVNMDSDQYRLGRSKVFIRNPESLFLLEESRERKYDGFARIIQKAFKKFNAGKHRVKMKSEAAELLYGRKERHRFSLNRNFAGDYIGLEHHPAIHVLVGKREKITFVATVNKYSRRFKLSKVDLIVSTNSVCLVGREVEKKGVNKGKVIEILKRKIFYSNLMSIGLSPCQDNFIVINVKNDCISLLETPLKTEFAVAASKCYKEFTNGLILPLEFRSTYQLLYKKTWYDNGNRMISFMKDEKLLNYTDIIPKGRTLSVRVGPGLPSVSSFTEPSSKTTVTTGYVQKKNTLRSGNIRTQAHQNATLANRGNQVHLARDVRRPKPPLKPKPVVLVEAVYSYGAQDTDEISFSAGDRFELIKKDSSGWWQGRIHHKIGLFPGNYVKEL